MTLWYFRGDKLSNSSKYQISDTTLIVLDLTLDDAGIYSCLVVNVHGNESASAELKVQGQMSRKKRREKERKKGLKERAREYKLIDCVRVINVVYYWGAYD